MCPRRVQVPGPSLCAVVIADLRCKGTRTGVTESVRSASLACPDELQLGQMRREGGRRDG
ncbi:hypothetical protein CCMA1212_004595 [Trichoderma ghanense]|uniref:Uncharacterized protein n=1 Tax=Trichoderma ghanense TaxID=65468 RepID=A0ABY2H8D8_9HYPO